MYHVGGKEINLKERKEERKRRGKKRKEENISNKYGICSSINPKPAAIVFASSC
jgi:hypothetical protein